jgi:hypothetical protein
MATMPISEVPTTSYLADWGDHVRVIERTFETPQALWADRRQELQRFRARGNVRLFIDASILSSGRSTTTQDVLNELGIRHRALVPRDEAKLDYVARVEGAVAVQGRRPGINCNNDALGEVADRREPIAKTLCSVCPNKSGCTYYGQFEGLGERSLVLSHAHGGMLHLGVFANDAEIDVVDEDALAAVGQHDDLDADELGRFRVGVQFEFEAITGADDTVLRDSGYGDIVHSTTLDVDAHPCAATPALETIVARLQALLTTDGVVEHDVGAGRARWLTSTSLGISCVTASFTPRSTTSLRMTWMNTKPAASIS